MKRAIGVLDSGIGGLSVVREIRELLPKEEMIYFGDSAWCPYGAKSLDEIRNRVFTVADYLLHRGCKTLVIACNSATIAAVEALRSVYPVPIIGMEPGVRPAVRLTRSGVVGVLATEASLRGEKFHRLLDSHAESVRVITHPCPEFVELVERGELEGAEAEAAVAKHVDPILAEGADVLVLGCTHYPFLETLIARRAGEGVAVVNTGPAVARQVQRVLEHGGLLTADGDAGSLEILTTGDVEFYRKTVLNLPGIRGAEVVALERTV